MITEEIRKENIIFQRIGRKVSKIDASFAINT
jgi:hypothetical protein